MRVCEAGSKWTLNDHISVPNTWRCFMAEILSLYPGRGERAKAANKAQVGDMCAGVKAAMTLHAVRGALGQ